MRIIINSKYCVGLFLILSLLFSSCAEEKEFISPLKMVESSSLDREINYLHFPIVYPIHELENWLNEKFKGLLLMHTLTVEETDSLSFSLSRSSRIRLKAIGDKIQVAFPVRLEAMLNTTNYRGRERVRAIGGEALITLLVDARINEEWSLHSNSKLISIEWVRSPRIWMGFFSLNISKLIDSYLKYEKHEWVEKLDEIIGEKVSLKNTIEGVWHNIQKPIPIRKENPKLYLKIHPKEVFGKLSISEEEGIVFYMTVHAYTKIITDSIKSHSFIPLGNFQQKDLVPEEAFNFTVLAVLEYEYIANALNNFFIEYPIKRGRFVSTLNDFTVYGSQEGLVISFDIRGALRGRVVMVGNPVFDLNTGSLFVENLDYSIEVEGAFQKLILSNFYNALLDLVNDLICVDLNPLLTSLPQKINESIERGEKSSIFGLEFSQLYVEDVEYVFNSDHLELKILSRASMALDLRQMPVRKRFLTPSKK
jgi:hypothetical protein